MSGSYQQQAQRAFVVMNPSAGSHEPDKVRTTLETAFTQGGWQPHFYETHTDDHSVQAIRQAVSEGYDLVVAAGGDGTVAHVAHQLVGSDTALGIIPLGTANILARDLGLPLDIEQATTLLVGDHQVLALDVIGVGDRHFFVHVGIGLDALMIRETSREAKRIWGSLAYLSALLRRLRNFRGRRFRMVVDERELVLRATQVLVANVGTLGVAPLRWGPAIDPADGQLDLCIFKARSFFDYLRLATAILRLHPERSAHAEYRRVHRHVTIEASRPLPIQADGEVIGQTPVEITVKPGALRVIVPHKQGASDAGS